MLTNTEKDLVILSLIQRTPHVEHLAKLLRRKGFPTIDETILGTRFQKCRRLYDKLLRDCLNYPEERCQQLKKILHDSGNGFSGEILYSLKRFESNQPGILQSLKNPREFRDLIQEAMKKSSERTAAGPTGSIKTTFMQMFLSIKNGNKILLEKSLRDISLECLRMGMDQQQQKISKTPYRHTLANFNFDTAIFINKLGYMLLAKRDWMDKTLLHVAADSSSTECVDIVLKYASEGNRKSELLDAQDAFGQTALHLSIRRKDLQMTRKMIFEGSNVFIKNKAGQYPLMLIFQKLPAAAPYLLDTAITFSGDMSDQFCFNIDFSVLIAPSNFSSDDGNGSFHMKPQTYTVLTMEDDNHNKDNELEEEPITPTTNTTKTILDPKLSSDSLPLLLDSKYKRAALLSHELRILQTALVAAVITTGGHHRLSMDILGHPVVETFLELKWEKMRILLLTTYTGLRLAVYSLYMFFMYYFYFIQCPSFPLEANCQPNSLWAIGIVPTLIILCGFTLSSMIKLGDLRNLRILRMALVMKCFGTFLFNGAFLAIAIATSVPPLIPDRAPRDYEYCLATLGILLSSMLMLGVIGNSNWDFGMHSIYIHVYGRVMKRFMSVLLTFSPVIVAFTLAFNVMFPQIKEFATFWRSFFRLLIMLQGEFEYEDKVYRLITDNASSITPDVESTIQFWSGHLLFGVLGCVLTLVLIDVFLGYTVSDITDLKKQAEFMRLLSQVRQMAETEIFSEFAAIWLKFMCKLNIAPLMDRFNVISSTRKANNRTDVVISYEELTEQRLQQIRRIIVDEI